MTTDRLKEEMANAFQQVYGLPCSQIMPQELDSATLEAIYRRNCSWEWNYGKQLPFTFSCQRAIPLGRHSASAPGRRRPCSKNPGLFRRYGLGDCSGPGARPPWLPLCLDGAVSSSPQELPRAGRSPLSHAGRAGDLANRVGLTPSAGTSKYFSDPQGVPQQLVAAVPPSQFLYDALTWKALP